MIARVIDLCARHRALTAILVFALVGAGIASIPRLAVDAIPDLSDVQVIVTTEFPGQNPEVVEQQITYPLSTALLSVPGASVVRGTSMFEQSFVYVIFADGTDLYWAQSRVLERLSSVRDRLPKGVTPRLGPDATGVGWNYQYVMVPGFYCARHPDGLFRDEHAEGGDRWYARAEDAPVERRAVLQHVRSFDTRSDSGALCPLDGEPLVEARVDLGELRSLQDWTLRYALASVEGVSEVASIGGFVKQYQVVVDPRKLTAFHVTLASVRAAIERSNDDVGGSVIEMAEHEYMVRSRGYLKGVDDLAQVSLGIPAVSVEDGDPLKPGWSPDPGARPDTAPPIRLADVATIEIGGEARRGVGEYDGRGEAVGGIVVARSGENAFRVIRAVKAKLAEIEGQLPPGVSVRATYDRSQLIARSIDTLVRTLIEEIVVVGLVCILFLLHARSELVAVFVVPASVVVALFVMQLLGINANIMSLGGIAISIGVVVDSAIIMVENGHKHLDREEEHVRGGTTPRSRADVLAQAAREVGPQLFFSLLVITVSFVPVLVLPGEAGRLFRPLALTKTLSMAAAACLAITIVPVLMSWLITSRVLPARWSVRRNLFVTLAAMLLPAALLFAVAESAPSTKAWAVWIALGWALLAGMLLVPQKLVREERNPLSRLLQRIYAPVFDAALRHPLAVVAITLLLLASTAFPFAHIGTEFMPALDEGDLLYMPTTAPSVAVAKSKELLQITDRLIATFPEVASVHGKIGRAETATDPAPLSMIETVVQLETDRSRWRRRKVARFFDAWPGLLARPLATVFSTERPITTHELVYGWSDADGARHPGLNEVVQVPGVANAWPYPIENRLAMLATGIKTAVGIKLFGSDTRELGLLAQRTANVVRSVPGCASAFAEENATGLYLDIDVDRERAARFGLNTGDVQDVVQTAIGGANVTTVVDGPRRIPLNVRYPRELRDDPAAIEHLVLATPSGAEVQIADVARVAIHDGPAMIRSENARATAWVFVDVEGRDVGSFVREARERVAREVTLPPGTTIAFAGQFEQWEKTLPRLVATSSLALAIIVLLLYASSKSWFRVALVLLLVPFSLIGALWFTWALGYNLSLAVVIGLIALAGLDAEMGMVMLYYLDESFGRALREDRIRSHADIVAAVHEGAVKRIRPKAMTIAAALVGLAPLLWADGTGADVMRRLAAPLIGGLVVSFGLELVVYPVVFAAAKRWEHRRALGNWPASVVKSSSRSAAT